MLEAENNYSELLQDYYDFIIVGASFAGANLALKLRNHGSVLIIDKTLPGTFLNCAGGLPRNIFFSLDIDILNYPVKKCIVQAGEKKKSFSYDYLAVDRRELDRALWEKACGEKNVDFLKAVFKNYDISEKKLFLKCQNEEKLLRYGKLILANGFDPKRAFEFENKKPLSGIAQTEIIDCRTVFSERFYVKLNTNGKSSGYSWIFPMPEKRINIGFGWLGGKVCRNEMKSLKNEFNIQGRTLAKGGGVVPLEPASKVQNGDVYLFGDAAGLVAPGSGEGLKYIYNLADKWAEFIVSGKNLNSWWFRNPDRLKFVLQTAVLKSERKFFRNSKHSIYNFCMFRLGTHIKNVQYFFNIS